HLRLAPLAAQEWFGVGLQVHSPTVGALGGFAKNTGNILTGLISPFGLSAGIDLEAPTGRTTNLNVLFDAGFFLVNANGSLKPRFTIGFGIAVPLFVIAPGEGTDD
ncbi:MAG: hypothetical protein JRI25_10880, partial [Deltaproteobacteria bacterium]|nr:hypothetical protein [Deltaproteobacteria bacterium]